MFIYINGYRETLLEHGTAATIQWINCVFEALDACISRTRYPLRPGQHCCVPNFKALSQRGWRLDCLGRTCSGCRAHVLTTGVVQLHHQGRDLQRLLARVQQAAGHAPRRVHLARHRHAGFYPAGPPPRWSEHD
eukprot:1273642-Rhodomonas_salina.3